MNTLKQTLAGILGLLILGAFLFLLWQNHQLNTQLEAGLQKQEAAFRDRREAEAIQLFQSLLTEARREIQSHPKRRLSPVLISQISAANQLLFSRPLLYIEADSLREKNRFQSRARGFLLQNLIGLDMDSASFNKIKEEVSFAGALLQGLDLRGVDLSGADLMGTDLKNALLEGANFRKTDLRAAILWGAEAKGADFSACLLNRADLSWGKFDGASFQDAIIKGVRMKSSSFEHANLKCVILHYSSLQGIILQRADLYGSDLFGSDLSKANLREANFNHTDLRATVLLETNLSGASLFQSKLRDVVVSDQDWWDELKKGKVKGLDEIKAKYFLKSIKGSPDKAVVKIIDQG